MGFGWTKLAVKSHPQAKSDLPDLDEVRDASTQPDEPSTGPGEPRWALARLD